MNAPKVETGGNGFGNYPITNRAHLSKPCCNLKAQVRLTVKSQMRSNVVFLLDPSPDVGPDGEHFMPISGPKHLPFKALSHASGQPRVYSERLNALYYDLEV
jgi:hypothetical protein